MVSFYIQWTYSPQISYILLFVVRGVQKCPFKHLSHNYLISKVNFSLKMDPLPASETLVSRAETQYV